MQLLLAAVVAQVPNRPPSYMMNSSTIIMPCNNTGYVMQRNVVVTL